MPCRAEPCDHLLQERLSNWDEGQGGQVMVILPRHLISGQMPPKGRSSIGRAVRGNQDYRQCQKESFTIC